MKSNLPVPERDAVLEMRGIRKSFPGVLALDNVNFALYPGEVHILLGENGAGKSTLVKILSGAYQKDGGEILIHGQAVEINNPRVAQELGISIIYQEFNLIPHLSAAENIFLGNEPEIFSGIVDRSQMSREAGRLLRELGVQFDPRTRVRSLGIAQQQMVEVAKALSVDARILIMDEPTSALTESEIRALFSTIQQLKEKGVAVIYISHRLEELFEVGDRVTVLRDAKYIATHSIRETSTAELIRLMANRDLKEHFPREKGELGEEVLRVEGLNRAPLLKDISFSLRQGEIVGIAGLLGAGRTELARAIFGADPIDSGRVLVKGQPVRINSPVSAIRQGIGFLTEDRKGQGLILVLPVKDNIALPNTDKLSRLGVIDSAAKEKLAQRFIHDLSIKTPGVEQKVMYLSGGNQQKVVLSKWLAREADILIFDEPTRGIDVGAKVEIYQLMNQLTARGAGIIMISSELPEILGMSDRILVMHRGRISGEFSAEEATEEKVLGAALGQRV
ncbi:sugar ABC transporter ATP-binding protein [Acidobacteria bacterium AH-259-G07]|nr:sugar ABC transporter ATP-binding protein [Acidobacteria bacterium AH-259-G07]